MIDSPQQAGLEALGSSPGVESRVLVILGFTVPSGETR